MDQNCDPSTVECELRRIADLLAQPDWLDIMTGLVLPVILGIATVILAVFTITTAKKANELTVALESERVAREDRASRRAIVPDIISWVNQLIFTEPVAGLETPAVQVEALAKIRAHGHRLGETTMGSLIQWIRQRVEKYHDIAPADRPSVSEPYEDLVTTITNWANDPGSLAGRETSDLIRQVFDGVIAADDEARKQQEKLLEQVLKKLTETGN